MAKASPQHQARNPGDIIVLPRVTVHGGGQPAAGVEDLCLADLGLARGFLGNVIPFRRLKPSQAATPDCVVSLATRPAPLPQRLPSRGFWLALAVTLAAHAAAFAIFLREPPPLASIGVEAVSVEIVVGDNRIAGTGDPRSNSEVTSQESHSEEKADEVMQPPEQAEKPQDAAEKPVELAAVDPQPSETKPAEPEQKIEQPAPQPVEEKVEAKPAPQPIVEDALQKTTEPEKPVTAALAPETPKPSESKPVETKPVEKVVEPPVKAAEAKNEPKKPLETKRIDTKKRQEAKSKAKPTDKPANHDRAAAPRSQQQTASLGRGVGRSDADTNYKGLFRAHLVRFKPSVSESSAGTALIYVSVGASGALTGAKLASSSGNPRFDELAMSMVRRASPYPAPPHPLTVPVPINLGR